MPRFFNAKKTTEKVIKVLDQVKNIAANLAGNDLFLVGTALANSQDMGKITLLRALVEQNFIIIRQLDKITNK